MNRNKYLLKVCLGAFAILTLINWYGTINRERVYNVSDREYLSFQEAQKVAHDHDPTREYYFQVEYTEKESKTWIPFLYNEVPVTKVKRQLMSRPL